jgi:hypothetical protein
LEDDLRQFTGTQHYYRNFTGLLYTDGIHYLAERAAAYWLIDLVGSYQYKLRNVPFQVWRIIVSDDQTALITMREDDGQPTKIQQKVLYTDFPLRTLSWYCIDNVMMLKQEY